MKFAYTSDQWERIKAALPQGYAQRLVPEHPDEASISGIVRGMLEGYALSYLPDEHPTVDWAKVHKAAVDLLDILKPAAEQEARQGVVEIEEEGRWERFEPTTVRQAVRALDRLVGQAGRAKWLSEDGAKEDRQRRGIARPQDVRRLSFYDDLLGIWCMMGGKLTTAYDEPTDTHYGPLIEYLAAVTEPVMGDDAPAPSSMPKIVRDHKARCNYQREHPLI